MRSLLNKNNSIFFLTKEKIILVINMKKSTIVFIIILIAALGFATGFYLYKINKIDKESNIIAETIEDDCTEIARLIEEGKTDILQTNSDETKVSPNCEIILKVYYSVCGHIIEKKQAVKESEVNLTEDEIRKKFPDWELQKFTSSEIVLYKEIKRFCGEHYILKEQNGYIAIFQINEDKTQNLLQVTNISLDYLTQEDSENIKAGIIINSKKDLNKALEDYE